MKVRIVSAPKANNGMNVSSPTVNVEDNKYTMMSPFTMMINGEKHTNGGTMVNFNGTTIEAEKGEPLSINNDGDGVIWGNMKVPSTNMKFKSLGKKIAKEEAKTLKQQDKASEYINTSNPYDAYGVFTFNTGRVMQDGAQQKQKALSGAKEYFSSLQNAMLDAADNLGVEPQDMANKMKYGGSIEGTQRVRVTPPQAKDGATLAERNNNPGNLRYIGQKGATKGDKGFAKFDSYDRGFNALIQDIKAKQSGKTQTGLNSNSSLQDFINVYAPAADNNDPIGYASKVAGKLRVNPNERLGNIDPVRLAHFVAQQEDRAYYNKNTISTPSIDIPTERMRDEISPIPIVNRSYNIPQLQTPTYRDANLNPISPEQYQASTQQPLYVPKGGKKSSLADRNKLNVAQIIPEIATALQKPDYVQGQYYNPTLYTPYQMSMNDQLANNQATFNALQKNLPGNAAALSSLAAQKYQADQQVLGNEFRTNQQIANDVTNKNVQLLNQADLTNLQLADTQSNRQAQALANTRMQRNEAIASLTNKIGQNRKENMNIRLAENLFNYRPDENYQMQYVGPGQVFTPYGGTSTPQGKTKTVYDEYGNPVQTVTTIDQAAENARLRKENEEYKRKFAAQANTRKWGGRI